MLDANETWSRKQAVSHVQELERTLDLGDVTTTDALDDDHTEFLRAFRREPAFFLGVVGTFAIAIGANAAMFGLGGFVSARLLSYAFDDRTRVLMDQLFHTSRMTRHPVDSFEDERQRLHRCLGLSFECSLTFEPGLSFEHGRRMLGSEFMYRRR